MIITQISFSIHLLNSYVPCIVLDLGDITASSKTTKWMPPPCFLTSRKTYTGKSATTTAKRKTFNTSTFELASPKSKNHGLRLSVHFPPPNLKCTDLLGES